MSICKEFILVKFCFFILGNRKILNKIKCKLIHVINDIRFAISSFIFRAMAKILKNERHVWYEELCNSFVDRFFPSKSKQECQKLAILKWNEIKHEKDCRMRLDEVINDNKKKKPIPPILQLFAKKKQSTTPSVSLPPGRN